MHGLCCSAYRGLVTKCRDTFHIFCTAFVYIIVLKQFKTPLLFTCVTLFGLHIFMCTLGLVPRALPVFINANKACYAFFPYVGRKNINCTYTFMVDLLKPET